MHSYLAGLRAAISRLRDQVIALRRSSLHVNTYALVVNQVASAGFGVLYWMIAARLFTVEAVGWNSAVISTLMLLGSIGSLGLKSAMVRFVPRSGQHTARLVIRSYAMIVIATAFVSILFVIAGRRLEFLGHLDADSTTSAVILVLAAVLWCIFAVQDGVLTGLRQSVWVLVENQVFNLSKIALLLPAAWFAHDVGIAVSWFLPAGVLVFAANAFMFSRLIPRHAEDRTVQVAPVATREAMPSVTGDYFGSILAEAGVRILPLLVVGLLGASAGAYFYQAWIVSVPLVFVAQNMAWSFTAESAADRSSLRAYSRSILRQMAFLIIPGALLVVIAAPQILGLFGPNYAAEGTPLLRYLALGALPALVSTWYLAYSRVKADVLSIVLTQGIPPLLTLGLSYWWLPTYGITSIGVAWLVSNVLVTAWVVVTTAHFLFGHVASDRGATPAGPNEVWRRGDWRFLLPTPRPGRSAVFSQGLLAQSVAAMSDESVDGNVAPASECDLAVACDPGETDLLAAHAALRESGVVYTEWTSWRAGGPWGIRRRLRSAGFSDVRLYWAYPSPARARFWVPLPAGTAVRRYLAGHVVTREGALARLVEELVHGGLWVVLRLGLVPSLSAIAYKGEGRQTDLFQLLRDRWLRSHPAGADTLSFLLLTSGKQVDSSIACLVFANSLTAPRWVAKLPRIPESAHALRNEDEVLRKARPPDGEYPGLVMPRMVDGMSLHGLPVYVQTALEGTPLNSMLTRGRFDEVAARLTDWQLSLAGLPGSRYFEVDGQAYAEELLEKLTDPGYRLLDIQTLSRTRAAMSRLGVIRRVLAHNDFSPWNLIWTEAGLGAIDWSDAVWDGLPLMDLVYGLSNLAFTLDGSWDTTRMLATYRKLLDPSSPEGAVFEREVARYVQGVGLREEQVAPLRLLTWIRHSCFELYNFGLIHGTDAGHRWLHESVCIPLWRMELGMLSDDQHTTAAAGGNVRAWK